jgi:hypothetical protein
MKLRYSVIGNKIHVIFNYGTDLGTQNSTFCSPFHNIQSDVPFENIVAMLDALKEL